ncbi:Type IV secretory pathway, VirB4 components [Mycobacteroides abscessus subsp. massiliense]|uniref:Type IV secretory pathway, VirB4 components n=3 Tax=Mycobacteroides abscessus TaxID=36809 RepID=A0A1T8VIR1_9MYCO|nr:ATP-binding protein [Mycobacteroides abscessus]SKN04748.1 Type IV secretory pathway, VirB4 components [Mycobacteroides abscessus subsp. massiliense]
MSQTTTIDAAAEIQGTTDIVDGNLRSTTRGFYAEYRITPLPYGGRSYNEKRGVGADHEALFAKLIPFNPMFGGFLKPETEGEITAKSMAIGGHDGLQPVAEGTYPLYDEMVSERVVHLAQNPGDWPKSRTFLFAFPVGKSLATARRNRAKVINQLPPSWVIEPAQPHDMAWIWTASVHRGIFYMPSLAQTGRVADFTPAYFDDGAKEDEIEGYNGLRRPAVLKISPKATPPAYQVVLKASFPVGQMQFPGGTELFTVLDRTQLHADWAIQCTHIPHPKVVSSNEDVRKTIESNKYETALEPARINDDAIAEALLEDYDTKTALDKRDSVWFTVLVAVGGPTLEAVDKIVTVIEEVFNHLKVSFERIAGLQQELWAAMLPGNTVSPEVHALGDEVDIPGFSEMVPFTHNRLGSATGPIFGRNIKSGLAELFRINDRAILAQNLSSNLVLCGGLGAGKTTFLKMGMLYDAALGHLFTGYDRTERGELVNIAKLVQGHQILDLLNAEVSVDSLKTFEHDPGKAGRHALNMFINLLKFEMGSDEAVALSEALTRDSITRNSLVNNKRLMNHMLASTDEAAQRVGKHLRMWSNFDFTKALFDENLPPVNYRAPALIIRTHGMPAASAEELYNEHLYRRLSPEKLYMEAIYELTGYAMREVYFNIPTICSIYLPEAWHLARKPIGQEMIEICAHDSRKHAVKFVQDGHLMKYDWAPGQNDLIGIKMVGRTEEAGALDNLEACGLHPENNPEFLDDITKNFTTGQFLVSYFGQIGAIQTFMPTNAQAYAAMNTSYQGGA